MLTLIKGGTLYGPEKMGTKDVLIVGRTIAKISDRMDLPDDFNARIISATGKKVTPGLIDLHVHLLGGGEREVREQGHLKSLYQKSPELELQPSLDALAQMTSLEDRKPSWPRPCNWMRKGIRMGPCRYLMKREK